MSLTSNEIHACVKRAEPGRRLQASRHPPHRSGCDVEYQVVCNKCERIHGRSSSRHEQQAEAPVDHDGSSVAPDLDLAWNLRSVRFRCGCTSSSLEISARMASAPIWRATDVAARHGECGKAPTAWRSASTDIDHHQLAREFLPRYGPSPRPNNMRTRQ